jgi:transcriptional regulator GlxA family with amidase domain
MLLAFDGAGLLDLSGPAEVFACADALLGGGAYRVVIASRDGRDPLSSSGFRIGVTTATAAVEGPIDTLIVPGTWTWEATAGDAEVMDDLAAAAARSRRLAGVCMGAFLMAEAELLDGRRATTHWEFLDAMEERYPVFMQRPGGHAQLSVRLRVRPVGRGPLRPLLDAIAADPAADHRLSVLAARARFSERHLSRLFARELGMTPARYVEQVRLEAACATLLAGDAPLEAVAREAGFGSAETLRRAFARELGTTPRAYRRSAGRGIATVPA